MVETYDSMEGKRWRKEEEVGRKEGKEVKEENEEEKEESLQVKQASSEVSLQVKQASSEVNGIPVLVYVHLLTVCQSGPRGPTRNTNVTGSVKLPNTKLCVICHSFCCTIPYTVLLTQYHTLYY